MLPVSSLSLIQQTLRVHGAAQATALMQLATGLRINSAWQDPAGLIASERLRASLASIEAEISSLERADMVVATADGGLGEISGLLADAQALVVANAGDGLSPEEKQANQAELDSILASIDSIASGTSFNGQAVLDGSLTIGAGSSSLAVGSAATDDLGGVEIDGETLSLADLGAGGALNIVDGDLEGAQQALDAAISQVASERGELGAFSAHVIEPRLESLAVTAEQLAAAESIIRDTDYAQVTADLIRSQLLTSAAIGAFMILDDTRASLMDLFV